MARAKRHPKALGWGIGLFVAWFAISSILGAALSGGTTSSGFWDGFAGVQVFGFVFLLLSLILLLIGIIGEVSARAFNARDLGLARRLSRELSALAQMPPELAYEPDPSMARVFQARLVEVERHFDQQTAGAIAGTLEHRLSLFGSSFSASVGSSSYSDDGMRSSSSSSSFGSFSGTISGLSQVELGLSSTTRSNLMGDALFSVLEITDQYGGTDTVRVISMSRPGVQGWIADLVGAVADRVGGPGTHAGSGVLMRTGQLVDRFSPHDISYVTDRFKALHARPFEQRDPVAVVGPSIGRNAVIATQVRISDGPALRVLPAQFPTMFGQAIGAAFGRGRPEVAPGPGQASLPPHTT